MRSLGYMFLETIMKQSGIKKKLGLSATELEKILEKDYSNQKQEPPKKFYTKYEIEKNKIKESVYYKISSRKNKNEGAILFIHGGAYIIENDILHWKVIARLADQLGYTIYVPMYPLAPKHTYMETFNLMTELYKTMLQKHKSKKISILGDSAGAQIALSFCQLIKTKDLPQPNAMVLVSPVTDNSPSGEALEKMKQLDEKDCMLSAALIESALKWWAVGSKVNDYLVSPKYGDFNGLAPMYVFSGTYEMLNYQAEELIEIAKRAGVTVSYIKGEKMMHAWPYMPIARECKKAVKQIIEIIEKSNLK